MQPSQASVSACVAAHPASFSPGFLDFLAFWRAWFARLHQGKQLPVFLVSGGFRALIEPLREQMGLDADHVFANDMRFDPATGAFVSHDPEQPTARSGGKARALSLIAEQHSLHSLVMLGDGATDLEACPPAKLVVGYGGVAVREKVQQQAHVFVTSWKQLQQLLKQAERIGQ